MKRFFLPVPTILFLLVCANTAFGTGCTGQTSWLNGKTPDSLGRVHVTVNYSGGPNAPNSTVRGLMEGGNCRLERLAVLHRCRVRRNHIQR